MASKTIDEQIKQLTAPLSERGFAFEYFHQKGGDSSCVYICRYRKGKDFFDWRETSGDEEIRFVTFVNGEYGFPSLKSLYKKECRMFAVKHLWKRATMEEKRAFAADLLKRELNEKNDFFGIKL